ncbi:transcriptional repressor [Cysteiniphilum halobium]|uniref:transcriptional repressor n=1 Tax=Cysteiniphilum halobium TaxID=2219059 RepID=UPI000E65D33C|nr:transcriptional repressor [Cysteiniphilum halobium]
MNSTENALASLAKIESFCLKQKVKLTRLRKEVITIFIEQPSPISAYELLALINKAQSNNKHYNIMSIYRVLDFLQQSELIHKLYTSNRYSLCCHPEKKMCQLFICDTCGQKTELHHETIDKTLQVLAQKSGFQITTHTVEITGLCRDCLRGLS